MEFQLWRSEVNLSKVQKTLAFKMERRANTREMSDLQVLGKAGRSNLSLICVKLAWKMDFEELD